MNAVMGAIKNTVSISLFNRGQAGRIFEDVRRSGAKVVMKNNAAECVLLSPEEYVSLMEELNDARLMAMAEERLSHYDPKATVSQAELDRELGFTADDLKDADEVELA